MSAPAFSMALPSTVPVAKATVQTATRVGKKAPLLVQLERNQVYNRLFVESLGFYLWTIALARSRYEMMENAIDLTGWCLIGVLMPLALDSVFRQRIGRQLAKDYAHLLPKQAKRSLIEVPFEFLDKAGVQQWRPHWENLAKDLGFPSARKAVDMLAHTPDLQQKLKQAKLTILFVDLFFMALKGQLSQWGGKWLTEKLSGKKGFSGEFKYASDAYLEKQAAADTTRKTRQLVSLGWGLSGTITLPLLLNVLLKTKNTTGLVGLAKSMIPGFNYVDAVFMSKWLILWHNLFNWTAPSLLSARDGHEFREKLSKCLSFDFFYFFGDDFLNGIAAKWFSARHRGEPNPVGQLWEDHRLGPLRWPTGKRLSHVYDAVGTTDHWVYDAARNSFLTGLGGTTLGLGIMTTVLNNWYTRRKVLKEMSSVYNQRMDQHPLNVQPFDDWWQTVHPAA